MFLIRAYQCDIEDMALYQSPYSSDEDLPARVIKPLPQEVLIHERTRWKRIDKHTAKDPLHRKGRRRGRRRNKNKEFDSTLGYPGEGPDFTFCDTGVTCTENRHAHLRRAKGAPVPGGDEERKKPKGPLKGAKRRFAEKKVLVCKYKIVDCIKRASHLHEYVENKPQTKSLQNFLKPMQPSPVLPNTPSGPAPAPYAPVHPAPPNKQSLTGPKTQIEEEKPLFADKPVTVIVQAPTIPKAPKFIGINNTPVIPAPAENDVGGGYVMVPLAPIPQAPPPPPLASKHLPTPPPPPYTYLGPLVDVPFVQLRPVNRGIHRPKPIEVGRTVAHQHAGHALKTPQTPPLTPSSIKPSRPPQIIRATLPVLPPATASVGINSTSAVPTSVENNKELKPRPSRPPPPPPTALADLELQMHEIYATWGVKHHKPGLWYRFLKIFLEEQSVPRAARGLETGAPIATDKLIYKGIFSKGGLRNIFGVKGYSVIIKKTSYQARVDAPTALGFTDSEARLISMKFYKAILTHKDMNGISPLRKSTNEKGEDILTFADRTSVRVKMVAGKVFDKTVLAQLRLADDNVYVNTLAAVVQKVIFDCFRLVNAVPRTTKPLLFRSWGPPVRQSSGATATAWGPVPVL